MISRIIRKRYRNDRELQGIIYAIGIIKTIRSAHRCIADSNRQISRCRDQSIDTIDRRSSRREPDHSTRVTRAIFAPMDSSTQQYQYQSFAAANAHAALTVVHRSIHFDAPLSRLFLRLPTISFSAGRLRTVGGALRPSPSVSLLPRNGALAGSRSRGSRFEDQRIPAHRASSAAGSSAVPHLPRGKAEEEKKKREREREREREKGTRAYDERSLRVPLSRDREIGKSTTRDDARYHTARTLSARTCHGTPAIALSLCAQDDCRTPLPAYRPKVASSYHREAFVGRSPAI